MHLTIVGGCFPVQHNIAPGQFYHDTLRALLAPDCGGQWPELAIVRYERLSNCLAKVAAAHARQPTQVLLFHVRAEPVMRLAKFYYRYLNARQQVRHSLNLPWGAPGQPERYTLSARPQPAPAPPPETSLRRALRQLNLRVGAWLGNRHRALRQYDALVLALAGFCHREGIRLLLIGPVSRPCASEENRLSQQLHAHYLAFADQHGLDYLAVLGETDAAGAPLFFPDGIYVSAAGHTRIGHLLYRQLRPLALASVNQP
ncbi:MAG: hypothetical protein ACRYFX_23775 [Janthinobacterium lividum]